MLLAVTRGRLGFAAQSPYFVLLEGQTNSDLDKSYMPGLDFRKEKVLLGENCTEVDGDVDSRSPWLWIPIDENLG
jgi:hypothetical protein